MAFCRLRVKSLSRGGFLTSIFSNFTVFSPVPFAPAIYAFGATLNPPLEDSPLGKPEGPEARNR